MSSARSFRRVAQYKIGKKGDANGFVLVISQGSVLNFQHSKGAIVNAANEGCIGGGGVDGAISAAGGRKLLSDREKLPIIDTFRRSDIRCSTGDAKITGPNDYGSIGTPYVIHAVGPAYFAYGTVEEADKLLGSAYHQSLLRGREAELGAVAFSLLSAGVFRGSRSQKEVLRIGMKSICEFDGYPELSEVHMFAFSQVEEKALLQIANEMKLRSVDEEVICID